MPALGRALGLLAVCTVIASVVVFGGVANRAEAASPVVLVSTDGVSYQPALAVGLFDDAGLLVPGDTTTSDLWIKNPLSTPATIRVNVSDLTTSSVELADNLRLSALDTSNGSSVTVSWSQLASCDVLVEPVSIPGGAVLRVHLSLSMLDATGRIAQLQTGALTANVQMRDAAAGSFSASACDPGVVEPEAVQPAATHARKVLGYTGETFPTQFLILGGVLVGVGWFLIVARRRRKRAETPQ